MELNPPAKTIEKLKELAREEGVTMNAFITPFLNDIAKGLLVRGSHYPAPAPPKRDAA